MCLIATTIINYRGKTMEHEVIIFGQLSFIIQIWYECPHARFPHGEKPVKNDQLSLLTRLAHGDEQSTKFRYV